MQKSIPPRPHETAKTALQRAVFTKRMEFKIKNTEFKAVEDRWKIIYTSRFT
jgi:hypothetical protein